ncbi:hypothetical protein LQV63_05780 [Paenibacillus profundus]|uniref:Uncharacterized protein n=1 Tax=Paenibacillus profundus TaxID=1173085 RepID=A0ABS8YH35_9BACL|nr:hypothetical protein [Paenibacillus profundus]MCE5168819.1 hypothetical protein [Paenibacillus profundus]
MSVEITRNNAALILHDALQFNKGMRQGALGYGSQVNLYQAHMPIHYIVTNLDKSKKAENVEVFTALSLHDGKQKG